MKIEDLEDLASYSMRYYPFVESLPDSLSIDQFCLELAKEMEYHRTLDREQNIGVEDKQ